MSAALDSNPTNSKNDPHRPHSTSLLHPRVYSRARVDSGTVQDQFERHRAVPYILRSKRRAGRVASRGSSQEVRCGGRQDAICALWARNSRFARPAVAVCVRHWAETTSGRALGTPGRARAAWRTVARRGRSPATTAKRADFTATVAGIRHASYASHGKANHKETIVWLQLIRTKLGCYTVCL